MTMYMYIIAVCVCVCVHVCAHILARMHFTSTPLYAHTWISTIYMYRDGFSPKQPLSMCVYSIV